MSWRHPKFVDAMRKRFAAALCVVCAAPLGWAQQTPIDVERPTGMVLIRPYEAPFIPPVRLLNSGRLRGLIRAGKLYLTAQDAIALALENDIDVEIARYAPLSDTWLLERYEAGGALPGVPSASSQAGAVASGEGVQGSQNAAGVSTSGGNQNSGNTVGATISQIGPVTPTLDPVFSDVQVYSHRSNLFPNITQSGVFNLVTNTRNYNESISEGLITGGKVSLSYSDSYLSENAPTDVINPENGVTLSFSFQHNLLQGFGRAVNSRNITVAKTNLKVDELNFKNQVIGSVVNVLNLYYGLAADYEDLRAKQSALSVAQQFYQNNKKQVELGTMAPLDVTTAEAQVASSEQDLVVSEAALEQQQVQLKNVLSRTGLADPAIREVEIIPLDHINVPEKDDLPALKQLIASALQNRPDLAANQINLQNAKVSALGTENGLLPQLAALAGATNQGLNGTPKPAVVPPREAGRLPTPLPSGFAACPSTVGPPGTICEFPDPYIVGNISTGLGQVVRRNFPSEHVGGFIAPTLRNRQAQADFAIDQLSIRQTALENQRSLNQIAVDVSNQVIGLQQARVRYQAAVRNRILEQQLLEAEQKKFSLGVSTTFLVVQQQRDLATAQASEIASLVAYSNARVALDQTLGTTLEANHVTMKEAMTGQVMRPSSLPATLPTQP